MNDFQKPSSPFSDSPKKRKEMAKEADPLQDPFLEPLLPLEESSEHPEGGMMLTPLTPLTPEEDTSFLEASQESRVESWGKTEVRSSQEERTPVVDFEALQVQIEENKGLSRPKDQRDQRMLLPLEAEDSLDMSEKEELLNKGAMESQKISEYKKERKTTAVDFEALLEKSKEGEGFLARGDRTTVMDFQKMQEKVPLEKPVDLPSAVFQGIQNLQVDQYFITKEPLGEGAEAQVFLAYETEEREVPVGVLKLAKPGHENQLYKEIQIAKQFINGELEHENIVRFIKSGVTPRGLPFLVTEYLSPYPQERWTLEEAFSVTAKLATAVTYLHKNRIYHRDIKPANIKFIQKGQQIIPKLFDFGVATNQINEAQNAACSPYYAAPEMLLRLLGLSSEEPQFSKADVFSIAMTLLGFLNFNPYLSIEPDFEHRYKDPLSLTERLIKLQQKDPYLLNEHIEIYLKTNHQWTPEVEERCGIPEAKHQEFLEKTISLLQKSLAIKKEERPICSALVKQMSTLFEEVLGGTIENFLESGCFLFLSEKAAPQDSEQASTVPSLPSDGDPSPKIQERLEKLETYWNSALASNQNSKAIAFGQEILQLEPNRKDIQKQLSKLQKIQTVSAASLRLFKFFSFLFLLFILSGVVYNGFAFRYASELNRNFEKLLAPQPFLANLQKNMKNGNFNPIRFLKKTYCDFTKKKKTFRKKTR
jgi:serine/threonine protein kinase